MPTKKGDKKRQKIIRVHKKHDRAWEPYTYYGMYCETEFHNKKDLGFTQGLFCYFTAHESMKKEINEAVSLY